MRMLLNILIFTALPFMIPEKSPTPAVLIADSEYCNARYFFCVEYPDTLLPNKTISDNGDGIILSSDDNEVVVTIAGSRSVLNRRTPDLYADFVADRITKDEDSRVIYEIVDRKYYEVSFIDGAYHYYQKLFHQGNKYVIYQIVTPVGKDHKIDKIRNHLSVNFDI